MVATIDRSRPDVHIVKGSGNVATDTARIASAVSKIVAAGFGTIVFDGSASNGIVYNSAQHRTYFSKIKATRTPGTRLISTTQSSSFWCGGHYDPWDANEGYLGGTMSNVAAAATQIGGLPEFTLKVTATSGQYRLTINGSTTGDIAYNANAATILAAINAVGALTDKVTVTTSGSGPYFAYFNISGTQADTMTVANGTTPLAGGTATITSLGEGDWILIHAENTPSGITPHGTEPQRPMEFHRLAKQVLQNQARVFTLTISATAGQYRVTINGSQTADIAYNASSATIQAAINAVGALNGKVTVAGSGPFTFTMAGNFAHQQNTMTAANGTTPLSGGSASATVTTTTSAVNKINSFYIEEPTFDAFTTNPGWFKVPVVQGVEFSDLQIESAPGNGPASSSLFFVGCIDLKVKNCRFGSDNGRMNPGGVYRNFCTGTMEDCEICDHEDPNTTLSLIRYGSVDVVCTGFRHTRCKFGAVRHGFTNGGVARTVSAVSYRYGTAIDGVIEDCTFGTPNGQNPATAGVAGYPYLDFHSEAARYVVKGCKFLLTEWQVALQIRSRAITMEGNYFEGMGLSELGYIAAQDFVFKNNRVTNSYNLRVLNLGYNANVDKIRITDNQFIDCVSCAIRFSTGTGHEVVGNSFHNVNTSTTGVSSPWTPKCCVHVEALTNSSSTLRVANNTAPKFANNDFFVYASGINANQMEYIGNIVPGYGGTSIGLPRKRVSTGAGVADPTGAVNTPITATPEWEMLYAWQNGQQKLKYVNLTGHSLTNAELWHVIDGDGQVYDDMDDLAVADGVLADIINDDWYVLYSPGMTFEMPKTMLGGTYSMGSDPRSIFWDASNAGGTYVNNAPSGTVAPAMLRVNNVGATNMSVTLLGPGSGGGSFGETDLGTFGTSWIATETAADAMALVATTPATFPNVTTPPYAIVDADGVPINPALGGIQTWTIGANRTPSFASFGTGQRVLLHVSRSGSFNVTWTGVVWVGGSAPTIPASGARVVELWKIGSTIYGYSYGDVA